MLPNFRKKTSSGSELVDYVYINQSLVSSYADQLRPPVAYDKVGVWKAGVAWSGASVEGQQARPARTLTVYEQINFLERTLEGMGEIGGRGDGGRARFCLENCRARRFLIGSKAQGFVGAWISRYIENAGSAQPNLLVMLESTKADDEDAVFSASTQFVTLSATLAQKTSKSRSKSHGQSPPRVDFEDLYNFLLTDPAGFLLSLGAQPVDERSIRTLYKVKSTSAERGGAANEPILTVGYPLYIASISDKELGTSISEYQNH